MKKNERKIKIHRKYQDFYTTKDLKDPDTPHRINLTIEDFDAKGQVAHPRAPCVVTTIDPDYTKDAALQRRATKFRMKTDILRLREITRKKFVIYATQQRYIEKQRESAYQEHIYKRITEFQEFAADALFKMESSAFKDMRQSQKQLADLQMVEINEELKEIAAEHQRILMEVQEVYARFLFLLKLIGYFDEIISPEDIEDSQPQCKLPQLYDIVKLQINERNPVGQKEVSHIIAYMDYVVRPYLTKRNHLNADIWIKGYERTRQKIFNYNRRFAHVALLNHLVSVVHDKSKKTFFVRTQQPVFLKDPIFLTNRIEFLMERSLKILNDFERRQRKDKLQLKLNAIVPVILQRIEVKISQTNGDRSSFLTATFAAKRQIDIEKKCPNGETFKAISSADFCHNRDEDTLTKVEKMQWHLLNLLQDLEKYSPHACKQIETLVRKRFEMQKDYSRRALVKQNRLYNWMAHYRKHEVLRQQK